MSQSNLKYWNQKIQEKRKQTEFRDFLMEIASWKPYEFCRNGKHISRYPISQRVKNIVSVSEYKKESQNIMQYSIDIGSGENFFQKYATLLQNVPHSAMITFYENENSEFSDCVIGAKNAYLSSTIGLNAENIVYSAFSYSGIYNIFNSFLVTDNTSNVYFSSVVGKNSMNIFYSKYIINSSFIWFSSNLIGCSECIFCDNLQNQKYCIYNKQYTKEEYETKKQEVLKNKNNFLGYYSHINSQAENFQTKQSSGNALYSCENIENGYFFHRGKNSRNVMIGDGINGCEEFYDCFDVGVNSHNFYGCCSVGDTGTEYCYIAVEVTKSTHIYYSYNLVSCHYCLGCIGLKNKSYCIFNKQYSKEDWYKKVDEIFAQMESEGTLGEFFPGELNPFYFNDTMAGLIGGFTKEEVVEKGYMWRDEKIKVDIPENAEIVYTVSQEGSAGLRSLQDFQGYDENGKWYIDPEILKKVIQDEKGNYYRIVEMEYDFLVKHELPLPEIHWMDRMKLNFGL